MAVLFAHTRLLHYSQQTGSASYPLSCHVQDCQGPVLSL